MDLVACLLWLAVFNTLSTAAFLTFFSLIGSYWVKNRTPVWLEGPGLYAHHFLDGLEYSLTRTALGVSLARNLLVFKLFQKNTNASKLAAGPGGPGGPHVKATTAPVTSPEMPDGVVIQPKSSDKGRVRARIVPPAASAAERK